MEWPPFFELTLRRHSGDVIEPLRERSDSTALRIPESPRFGQGRGGQNELRTVVLRFEPHWWHTTRRLARPPIVEPIHPFERGVLHCV